MTKNKKILLGIFTFLPAVFVMAYVFIFLKFFFSSMGSPQFDPYVNEEYFFGNLVLLILLIFAAMIFGLGMMIYYIIHANKNPKFDSNQKLLWILILVLTSFLGNIIYYFVEIIPEKQIKN
jgi:hypothetical protein